MAQTKLTKFGTGIRNYWSFYPLRNYETVWWFKIP